MNKRIRILAISGSTRKSSSNLALIQAIRDLYAQKLEVMLFTGLLDIPHFNPDHDTDSPPETVSAFRKALRDADGLLICTPEYAMGVPGSLKNAIDWTVSSMEFSHKPVALITASSLGHKAHESLLGTLQILEATLPESSRLLLPYIKTRMDGNKISDPETAIQVGLVMESLINTMNTKQSYTG